MKVLQVIDSLATGGAEKLLLESLPLYRKTGIEMDVLVLKDQNFPFMQALEKLNCCKIYKLGEGTVYNPLLVFKIAKILSNYDIAHVHLFPAQYWVVFAKQISGAKTQLVFTEHSTSNKRIRFFMSRFLENYIYKKYSKIIAITQEVKEVLLSHLRVEKNSIAVILNGVDVFKFQNAKSLKRSNLYLENKDFVIVQVSSFKYPKDQSTVIKALIYLPKEIKLLLVGDGPLRKECEELVSQLGLCERVNFLGNRTDVPNILKTADVVVLSSYYEGMSLSSIEGMASGRPFVASDVPGLSSLINGVGLLFPVGNEKTLASLLIKLERNTKLYQDTVENCLKSAEKFDIETMINHYITLYENIIA